MKKHDRKQFELEELVTRGAASNSDYFNLGAIYLINGHYDKLFALYSRLKTKQLSNLDLAQVYHEEGEAFTRCGKRDDAKISFEKSIQLLLSCDDSIDCFMWKGLNIYKLFISENDPDILKKYAHDALSNFGSFIKVSQDPEDNCMIYSYMADIYNRIDEFDNAIDFYNTALHLTQHNEKKIWILSGIASIYSKRKEYKEAFKFFKYALELADQTTTPISKIYFDIGLMYFDANRWQDAKKAFEEALKIKPGDYSPWENQEYEISILWYLGSITYEMQDSKDALKYLNEVLAKIDSNHYYYANTHLTIGHYYYKKGEYESARVHYNLVLTAPQVHDDEIKIAKESLAQLPLNG